MSLAEARSLRVSSSPLRATTATADAYVISLTSLYDYYVASESAPSNVIGFFDKTSLRRVQTIHGHDVATTYVRSVPNVAGLARTSIVSSGRDGTVKIWDERSTLASITLNAPSDEKTQVLCFDVSSDGQTIAGGTVLQGDDASILYWDPRKPPFPLRIHNSTHSDDITALHFLPTHNPHNVLLSGSSDGLVCTSNADEDDEDEAALHVGNWGCSVAQAGWIVDEPHPSRIWASSDMETFSTWSNELDLIHNVDIRVPSVHSQERTWVTDYLIAGHCSRYTGHFSVFVGSNEGDVALISGPPHSNDWLLHRLWTTGHVGVVRSVLWDEPHNILLTGGEDSTINVWPCPPLESQMTELTNDADVAMDVDESPPRKRERESDQTSHGQMDQFTKRSKII